MGAFGQRKTYGEHRCAVANCKRERYKGSHDGLDPGYRASVVVAVRSCDAIEVVYNGVEAV